MKIGTVKEEIEKILHSKKYKHIHPATVMNVLEDEFGKYSSKKQALENARVKLHQILAGYLGSPQIAKFKSKLNEAFESGVDDNIRSVCLEILKTHKSTSERIPILNEFYSFIFDHCGRSAKILDLASALNPFTLPWMQLNPDAVYYAYDINSQFIDFHDFFFKKIKKQYKAEFRDIYINIPDIQGDIAFLFKMYHCLEKRKHGAGMSVLKNLRSKWIAITFPTRSLANRAADIAANYESDIYQHAESQEWKIIRKKFETEDLILIRTNLN